MYLLFNSTIFCYLSGNFIILFYQNFYLTQKSIVPDAFLQSSMEFNFLILFILKTEINFHVKVYYLVTE